MKNLIKVMLLPIFLLASLSVFAKEPVNPSLVGTWNAKIVYLDKTYKGSYTFNYDGTMSQTDTMVFTPDWYGVYNIAEVPAGGMLPFVLPILGKGIGSWEVVSWGADSVNVIARYSKAAKVGNKTVYKQSATLKLVSVKNGVTKGALILTLRNAQGDKKIIDGITVYLTKVPGIQY